MSKKGDEDLKTAFITFFSRTASGSKKNLTFFFFFFFDRKRDEELERLPQ